MKTLEMMNEAAKSGYICDKCKIAIWVSYSSIDKEFINNEQNNL